MKKKEKHPIYWLGMLILLLFLALGVLLLLRGLREGPAAMLRDLTV